jgi:hypothetical protein
MVDFSIIDSHSFEKKFIFFSEILEQKIIYQFFYKKYFEFLFSQNNY